MWMKFGSELINMNQAQNIDIKEYNTRDGIKRYAIIVCTSWFQYEIANYPNLRSAKEALDRLCSSNLIDYEDINKVLEDPYVLSLEIKTDVYIKGKKYLVYTSSKSLKGEQYKPYETKVFTYDMLGRIDFLQLYFCGYLDIESAKRGHKDICTNLEEILYN